MSDKPNSDSNRPRQGAIAVVCRNQEFLVIQRAEHIRAGGLFCFPGGGIEQGETSREAVVRELKEELGVTITPVREVWQCTTNWAVDLSWWLAEMELSRSFCPDPNEVQWVGWKSLAEMKAEPKMLSSNLEFIACLESGHINLD